MVKIVWTEVALQDLKEIFDFIAVDSERYAMITTQKIYQKVQNIALNPRTGRIVPEFNEPTVREIISGNYRIIYQTKNYPQIEIVRIFHSSRLLKN